MKIRTKIIITLSLIVVLLTLAYYKGLFSKYNFVTAYYRILTKNYSITEYGELGIYEPQEYIIAPRLGFKIEREYGCAVTSGIVNGSNDYNRIMSSYIDKNVCKDWHNKLLADSKELFRMDSLARSIINVDSLKQTRSDIKNKTNLSFEIDKRGLKEDQLSGYGYDETLNKTYKYFDLTVDLKEKRIIKLTNTCKEIIP
jgi:hypothetical protein